MASSPERTRPARADATLTRAHRRRARFPMLAAALALALTALVDAVVLWDAERTADTRFHAAVHSARNRIDDRIDVYVGLLYGARGLFAGSGEVTATEFRRYVDRLELTRSFRGVLGIGYTRWLNPPGARSDERTLRDALHDGGAPADTLWPRGVRDEYHAVVYLEPMNARNRAALGFDMHTDATRRAAMDRARDRAEPAASGAVLLKQEIDSAAQPGFLVYMPVYAGGAAPDRVDERRTALRGFVYAAFRAYDLFDGLFAGEAPTIAFRVFAGESALRGAPLYDSRHASPSAPPRADAARIAIERIDVAGQPWTIVFAPRDADATERDGIVIVSIISLVGVALALVLHRVTRAEVRSREAAEASDALRTRFFAAMSHELRTPVNAVLGYNDLLLTGVYGSLAPAQEQAVQRSQRAARHLLELVTDVLDLSKLEAGKVEVVLEPVRVDEIVEDLLATVRPMADERGCALRLDRPACATTLETDPRRLRQILLNLLSNATKFGAGAPVVVHCTTLPQGSALPGAVGMRGGRRRTAGDALVIAVTDAGPGIAAEDQQRIFEEFVQLPGSTPGGTGLGLPISRRLAELLGGTLSVESTLGRGSTFFVTLPCARRR